MKTFYEYGHIQKWRQLSWGGSGISQKIMLDDTGGNLDSGLKSITSFMNDP